MGGGGSEEKHSSNVSQLKGAQVEEAEGETRTVHEGSVITA